MTKKEYSRWVKNGNFNIPQSRMWDISNFASENMPECFTKVEAMQCICYLGLELDAARRELAEIKFTRKINASLKRIERILKKYSYQPNERKGE